MRIRIVAALTFALLLFFNARGQGNRVQQLAPGIYFWQGDRDKREPANCTWVVFKDYVLAIDANFPWGAREILPEIKRTTSKPIRFVFNTHYHGDHSTGNSLFVDAGATVVCSQACDGELRTKGVKAWAGMKGDAGHSMEGTRFEAASVTFSDGMVFDDGTQRVELTRLGPGHSSGDAVAYLPKEKILVTGDLCVTWAYGNNVADADADYDNWLRALDKMASWDVKTVIPGHGTPAAPPALRVQHEYLADMLSQVRAGLHAGKSTDELAKIDLSKDGFIAGDAAANANSIRAMYRHLAPK
jgi:glyoxylase-like metal-dependent hydrolase (beta-lactamase superfamily II)